MISLLVLIISSTASYISIKKLLESNFWVNHTQEIIYNLNEGSALVTESQTSVRGYLLTGNKVFLSMYKKSELDANSYFDTLKKLTNDNPKQQKYLRELEVLRNNFSKYLNNQIAKKLLGKQIVTFDLKQGKLMMDELKVIFKNIENNERLLLKQRNSKAEQYIR